VVRPKKSGLGCVGKATFYRLPMTVSSDLTQDDADGCMAVLDKRMERFGLTLHPEKTRLLDFRRPHGREEKAGVRRRSISSGSAGIGGEPGREVGQ